jgi:transcriptional regulator with XRE-family HTH domain
MTIKVNKSIDALEATKDIWSQMTFGGLIRSLRISDEVSQVDLAKMLKVSKQFLNDVEHNRKEVGISFAKKVAKALKYSIEPLIELLIRDQLRRQKLYYDVEIKKAS